MEQPKIPTVEGEDTKFNSHRLPPKPTPTHRLAEGVAGLLEQGDALVYTIVGICFIGAALVALGYSFWDFASRLGDLSNPANKDATGVVASAIIKLVSDLLLVLLFWRCWEQLSPTYAPMSPRSLLFSI